MKTIFLIFLVVIYVTLNGKPLKKCMYFWVPIIACPNLTSLYINYTTNRFVPVVRKRILDIMLPLITSSLRESYLVNSLVYFSSLHHRLTSLFHSSLLYIFHAYILASRVYFSWISCIFFKPTSSLRESILVKSCVYFSIPNPRPASLF